jgi:hypothetical protein
VANGYGAKIDAVLDAATGFTREDWARLALAALDQANVTTRQLADADRYGRGRIDNVLDELGVA